MILGLDTATGFLHLAVVAGERVWTRRVEVGAGNSHSLSLLPSIQTLMQEAGSTPADLTGVCCCAGPGGFTSLRIGVATAEGLALTGIPTWGFSSFQLRARALAEAGWRGPCWILLDGQRGEAFLQRWEADRPTGDAQKRPLHALAGILGEEPWWAPADLVARLPLPPPVPLADEGAAALAALAALCRELPATDPEVPIHPFYLRETDAELNFPEASAHLSDALRQGLRR